MEQQKLKVGDVVQYKNVKGKMYRIVGIVPVQTENGVVFDYTLKDCENVQSRQFGDLVLEKIEPTANVATDKKEPSEKPNTEQKSVYKKTNKKKKK